MSIKAVIFDLDGTITEPFFDFDAIRVEMGLDRNAGPILEAMRLMSPDQLQSAERILARHEVEAVENSTLNPGARDVLEWLEGAGIKIAILTRNTRRNALEVLARHSLAVDLVIGREEGPVKPDGFGVVYACDYFGIETGEAMVVGDYVFDLLCARSAGAWAVLLKVHRDWNNFTEHSDFAISKLDEIITIIRGKNDLNEGAG